MIALILPFLPYILAALASLASFGANWWLDFTDWQTAVTAAVALIACVFVSNTGSPWSRLIISGIIGAALYIKGGIDTSARLLPQHEREKEAIHAAYTKASQAEKQRQQEINRKAAAAAAEEKERQDAERMAQEAAAEKLAAEASNDVDADRPSFSIDAVRRLNTLRVQRPPGS